MALADILERIERDTQAEVAAIEHDAAACVSSLLDDARATAEAAREKTMAAAEIVAKREAERIVVTARLQARDEEVAARRVLIDEALVGVATRLAELPDDRYAALVASRIAQVARGGERVAFGTSDASRAAAILSEVEKVRPGLGLAPAAEPAPFARGALVLGDRTSADLSLEAIVAERRGELELTISRVLLGEGE